MNPYILVILFAVTMFLFIFTTLHIIYKDKLLIVQRINKMISFNKKETFVAQNQKKNKDRRIDTKIEIFKALANELSLSGVLIRPSEFLVFWTMIALVPSSLFLMVTRDFIIALGVLLIGLFLPPLFLHIKKAKRVDLFEKQLVDALAIVCNCLRSGLTFPQALESISKEMPEPISKEFGRVLREMKFGNTIEKALTNMANRINSKDFMLIVSAVLIQRQIGGNLSDILSNIAGTIKERYKIKKDIKVLTTTGRTSGMVVGLMPVVILLFFFLINPDYVRIFFESTAGIVMLITAVTLESIGFLLIRKIVNIKF